MLISILIRKPNLQSDGYPEITRGELHSFLESKGHTVASNPYEPDINAELIIINAQVIEDIYYSLIDDILYRTSINQVICIIGNPVACARDFIYEKYRRINAIIPGEYENVIINIINNIESKTDLKNIIGIYKEKKNLPEQRSININYDEFPMPDFSYLYYDSSFYNKICYLTTSRECNGKCSFCEGYIYRTIVNNCCKKYKTADRVIEEIIHVNTAYQQSIIAFSDDNFFPNPEEGKLRAYELAEKILSKKIKIKFILNCRADNVDYEIFKLLKRAGLMKVFIGYESGSEAVLQRYDKQISVDSSIMAIKTLNQLNIRCDCGIIMFDPWTEIGELRQTIEFFKKYEFQMAVEWNGKSILHMAGHTKLRKMFIDQAKASSNFIFNEDYFHNVYKGFIPYPFFNKTIMKIYGYYMNNLKKINMYDRKNILNNTLELLERAIVEY